MRKSGKNMTRMVPLRSNQVSMQMAQGGSAVLVALVDSAASAGLVAGLVAELEQVLKISCSNRFSEGPVVAPVMRALRGAMTSRPFFQSPL